MPAKRTFTLADAIVLIAAIGLGFAWARFNMRDYEGTHMPLADRVYEPFRDSYPIPKAWRPWWYYVSLAWVTVDAMIPCVAVLTLAVLALGLKSPRPPLRRLVRRPGFAGCLAASTALIASGFGNAVTMHLDDIFFKVENPGVPDPYPHHYWRNLSDFIEPSFVGIAVIGAWSILLFGGRRNAKDWVERTGQVLGFAWAMTVPIAWISRWLVN